MWGWAAARLADLQEALARERDQHEKAVTVLRELLHSRDGLEIDLRAAREQLAALRSSFEWLTTHVNQLQEERSQLLARVLGVSFPAMEIGVSPVVAPTPGGAGESRIHGVPLADRYENTVPGTQVATSMFEDPGDDGAAAVGAAHDPLGNVVYSR